MPRKRHANKDIEEAVAHAELHGWRIEIRKGHAWGADVLPVQYQGLPVRRVLCCQYLEHTQKHAEPRKADSSHR